MKKTVAIRTLIQAALASLVLVLARKIPGFPTLSETELTAVVAAIMPALAAVMVSVERAVPALGKALDTPMYSKDVTDLLGRSRNELLVELLEILDEMEGGNAADLPEECETDELDDEDANEVMLTA